MFQCFSPLQFIFEPVRRRRASFRDYPPGRKRLNTKTGPDRKLSITSRVVRVMNSNLLFSVRAIIFSLRRRSPLKRIHIFFVRGDGGGDKSETSIFQELNKAIPQKANVLHLEQSEQCYCWLMHRKQMDLLGGIFPLCPVTRS